jgi:uncharacterized cupin superfamily protein
MNKMIDLLELLSNRCVDALTANLVYEDLPAIRRVVGYPRVGKATLGQIGDREIGIWEISPSTSTDIEVDEFFIVLQGEATVRFADRSPDMVLRPGTVGLLAGGAATTWSVTRTLRKIYIA